MRGSETVVLVKLGPPDRFGQRTETERIDVTGCVIWPRQRGDAAEQGAVIIEGLNVFMPPGTDPTAVDRIEARGKSYEIEGVPGDYRNTGGRKLGLQVVLRRVGA
jgi:hypothetical protein